MESGEKIQLISTKHNGHRICKIQVFDWHSSPPAVEPRKTLIEMSIKEMLYLQMTVTHVFFLMDFFVFSEPAKQLIKNAKGWYF